jgi:hypothetical protein
MNAVTSIFSALVSPVTKIADKLILDKDKYAEIQLRKIELEHKSRDKLLAITTTPRIDALVKLLIAIRDVVIPILRPLGSACMTAFGLYAHYKGIEIDLALHGLMDSAFPGWMASRHVNKQTETKAKADRNPVTEEDFY